ncbi:hypothetical protein [Streptomyces sp. NPDC017890]|uniref:hypothetical protein n=1 Tax=Streptomyces sp. NPDC017890 TaxID=3365015 RepID=UPI00379AA56B
MDDVRGQWRRLTVHLGLVGHPSADSGEGLAQRWWFCLVADGRPSIDDRLIRENLVPLARVARHRDDAAGRHGHAGPHRPQPIDTEETPSQYDLYTND